MKSASAIIVLILAALLSSRVLSSQGTPSTVFLLYNARQHQWCAYTDSAMWSAAVEDVGAMTVGGLSYSASRLQEIDLTQTDESGDWTVYDRYFLDSAGSIVQLSRTINVLPGDRSVLQQFSMKRGKLAVRVETEKELSTGRTLRSPKRGWLPDLPIIRSTRSFPFARLIRHRGVRASKKTCATPIPQENPRQSARKHVVKRRGACRFASEVGQLQSCSAPRFSETA